MLGVLHQSLLVPVMYGNKTVMRREERSRIKAVQMDNFRSLLGIRRMDKVPNTQIRQLCGVMKGVDKKINEGLLRWFGHMGTMENDRIAKSVYVVECDGSGSVGRPQKKWIDTVKDCLKKIGLDVRQAGRMVYDRSVRQGFVEMEEWRSGGSGEA